MTNKTELQTFAVRHKPTGCYFGIHDETGVLKPTVPWPPKPPLPELLDLPMMFNRQISMEHLMSSYPFPSEVKEEDLEIVPFNINITSTHTTDK